MEMDQVVQTNLNKLDSEFRSIMHWSHLTRVQILALSHFIPTVSRHTLMRANNGTSLTFLLLRKAGTSTQLTNLHSLACKSHSVSPASSLTASIFLHTHTHTHPHQMERPQPLSISLLKTASPTCTFPTYRQENVSTHRALTETHNSACLSNLSPKLQFQFLTTQKAHHLLKFNQEREKFITISMKLFSDFAFSISLILSLFSSNQKCYLTALSPPPSTFIKTPDLLKLSIALQTTVKLCGKVHGGRSGSRWAHSKVAKTFG